MSNGELWLWVRDLEQRVERLEKKSTTAYKEFLAHLLNWPKFPHSREHLRNLISARFPTVIYADVEDSLVADGLIERRDNSYSPEKTWISATDAGREWLARETGEEGA